jgi:hypothetical protein
MAALPFSSGLFPGYRRRSTAKRKPGWSRREYKPGLEDLENRVNPSPLAVPQHYPNIRIAEMAFFGAPLSTPGAPEDDLLQNSVDLVVRDEFQSATDLNNVSQYGTKQLIYTNFSDLTRSYDDIGNPNKFTDFYEYADKQPVPNREGAFFHVASSTGFTFALTSPLNQQPQVTWFSRAIDTPPPPGNPDITNIANGSTTGSTVSFSNAPIYLGYPDPFREIDISVNQPAASTWSYHLEYVSGVDGSNNPIWTPYSIPLPSLTTGGTTAKITFDPPSGWKPVALTRSLAPSSSRSGDPYLYYMRLVASGSGTAPTANTILGYDYLQGSVPNPNPNNIVNYTIPAFDYAADTNHDGYLSDFEWNNNMSSVDRTTYQARFVYQTRLVTGYPLNASNGSGGGYGPMRVVTNPANSTFQAWVSDYENWNLGQRPASGLFVDNSRGQFPQVIQGNQTVTFMGVLTSEQSDVTNYTQNYASLLKNLQQTVGLVVPNTGGWPPSSEIPAGTVLAATQTSLKENVLLPFASNWSYFEAFANQMAQQNLDAGGVYTVLGADLHAKLNSGPPALATDPQAQLTTLAEYYLVADPSTTFLLLNNPEHSTSWTRSWLQAAAYDIGQPTDSWSSVKSAPDPANPSLTYHIYQRDYTNALVLYRPRSNDSNGNTGELGDNSANPADPYTLGQYYYVLEPDGTLERNIDGSPYQVNQVSLANGQGIILIKATGTGVTDSFTRPDANLADGILGAHTWTAVNPHSLDPGPGTMLVVAGAGVQVSGGGTGTFATSVLPNINIGDVALEADVTVAQDASTDLIARYQTSGNPAFYEASLSYTPTGTYQEAIWRFSWNGSGWVPNNLSGTYSVNPTIPGKTHHLRFAVANDGSGVELIFYVDGQSVIDTTDSSPLPAGAVGIRGSIGDIASPTFLNFVMQQPAFSGSPQEVYFSDDFARAGLLGNQPLWTVQPNTDGGINNGSFNVSTGAAVASGPPNYVGGNALINGLTLGDVVVQADVYLAPGGTSGYLLARYSGSSYGDPNANFYEAGIYQDTGTSEQVFLFRNGQYPEQFGPVEITFVPGQRRVRLEAQGQLLRVYVDNVLVISVQDPMPALAAGLVGIRSHYAGVTFDNFQAAALGAFSSRLAADEFNEPGTSLSSAWTVRQGYFQRVNGQAEGDDGGNGRSVAVAQGTVAANVSVSATVTVNATNTYKAGLIAGYQDLTHYYMGGIEYVSGSPSYLEAQIFHYNNNSNTLDPIGTAHVLHDAGNYIAAGTPIHLTFAVVGNNLSLSVGGSAVVTVTLGASVGAGEVGILADPGETVDDFSSLELGALSSLLYADQFNGPVTSMSTTSWWNVAQGYFQLANGQAKGDDGSNGRSVAVVKGISATNVSLSATVTVASGSPPRYQVGVIAGYQDATHYYGGVIRYVNGQLEAVIIQYDGANGIIDRGTPYVLTNMSPGMPINLGFSIVGSNLSLSVNGTVVVTYTTGAPVGPGGVGIYADPGENVDDFSALSL